MKSYTIEERKFAACEMGLAEALRKGHRTIKLPSGATKPSDCIDVIEGGSDLVYVFSYRRKSEGETINSKLKIMDENVCKYLARKEGLNGV